MSRNLVVYLLMLSVLGACSSTRIGGIGPHRIDVQQGNALDQESVAKLKPGLTRSQVRFLLGTPLLVDPFRPNRWDYVYTFHKAGKLAEQKRITLFFDNDVLQRMEGDVPVAEAATPAVAPAPAPATVAPPVSKSAAVESTPIELAKKPEPVVAPAPTANATPPATAPSVSSPAPAVAPAPLVQPAPVSAAASATPTPARPGAPQATSATTAAATSVVAPLAGSTATPSTAARPSTDLKLNPETNVAQIQPNVIPPFPDPNTPSPAKATEASVLSALQAWADAWSKGNADAYIAAYAADYAPPGGTRAAWEKRRRSLLGIAKNVELRIEAPKFTMAADGHAVVTFKQYYRSTNARDDLVKQIKFAQRDGRWVIVEELVVSTLQAPKL